MARALQAIKQVRSDRDQRRVMNRVWCEARPVETGDPVARYLLARTGLVSFPACIRTAARLCYNADVTSFHPAMVAMVTGADGKPVNIHRTYLTLAGTKAPLEEPRRLMPGKVPHGSAIRLTEHSGVLGIAEGIETALVGNGAVRRALLGSHQQGDHVEVDRATRCP